MSGERAPTDRDGPLFQAAARRAGNVDDAATSTDRRKAWARFVPTAVAAIAEGFLRECMISGAVLFSIIVAIMGATSGETIWTVVGLTAGLGGTIAVFVAIARWSFARQWAVLLGTVLLQVALMTAYWQTG